MITLKKISQSELKPLVEVSFKDDSDLICRYHICQGGFEECVEDTVKRIKEMSSLQTMEYYKVIYDKKPIGFVALCYKRLYSFGIGTSFRKRDILIEYWQAIKRKVGNKFICSLYMKNTRAISFLKKNGMQIGEVDQENKIVTLIN